MANVERHLGIDIGGTNIACGIVDDNCEIIRQFSYNDFKERLS